MGLPSPPPPPPPPPAPPLVTDRFQDCKPSVWHLSFISKSSQNWRQDLFQMWKLYPRTWTPSWLLSISGVIRILMRVIRLTNGKWEIERKAMIRNRYNYSTPPIRHIKGKETRTQNNWTLMETSLAESQTNSYFPTKWPNGYPKQKRCKRHTHSKTNFNKNKPWQKNRLGTVSEKYFTGGLKSNLRGHNLRPYFCRGLDT